MVFSICSIKQTTLYKTNIQIQRNWHILSSQNEIECAKINEFAIVNNPTRREQGTERIQTQISH